MHPQCSPGDANASLSRCEPGYQEIYEEDQRELLDDLLAEYPGLFTYREALTARVADPDDFGEVDRFRNATHGLLASGLVIRQGELLVPTRPAREMVDLGFRLG
jgi:hypothetical protein